MIKIRVFDKRNSKYLPQHTIDNMLWTALNSNDYIIEFATGQQDRNGKDIYVGDIVYYERDEKSFIIDYDKMISAFSICSVTTCYTFDNLYGRDLVVVANVNENRGYRK